MFTNPPKKTLPIGSTAIQQRIHQLAAEILAIVGTVDVTVCGILQGAVPFTWNLTQCFPSDHRTRIYYFPAHSYSGVESRALQFNAGNLPAELIRGKIVILADDILETGQTLAGVQQAMWALEPAELYTAVLLRKPGKLKHPAHVDFVGFDIPDDAFVVGFGLDFNGMYRSRKDIKDLRDASAEHWKRRRDDDNEAH